jgi:hypothetical protein
MPTEVFGIAEWAPLGIDPDIEELPPREIKFSMSPSVAAKPPES